MKYLNKKKINPMFNIHNDFSYNFKIFSRNKTNRIVYLS